MCYCFSAFLYILGDTRHFLFAIFYNFFVYIFYYSVVILLYAPFLFFFFNLAWRWRWRRRPKKWTRTTAYKTRLLLPPPTHIYKYWCSHTDEKHSNICFACGRGNPL